MAEIDIEDYKLDETNDIVISTAGDIAGVSDRDAFEQRIRTRLLEKLPDNVGEFNRETVKKLTRLEVNRVVDEMDEIVDVSLYSAEMDDDNPDILQVTVVYNTGEELTFEVA